MNIDNIIINILSGNAVKSEYMLLKDWVSEDANNRHYFERIQRVWIVSGLISNTDAFDDHAGFERWKHKTRLKKRKFFGRLFWPKTAITPNKVQPAILPVVLCLSESFFNK